jgi:hypothetical protein
MRAIAVEVSANGKLGSMSTTYAPIGSCPSTCPLLKSKACYGMSGPVGLVWRTVTGKDSELIADAEAKEILKLSGKRDLRVHTLGDSKTDVAAMTVSAAAEEYMNRYGKTAFTYTHAWRTVDRKSWGRVSVLASCETPADVAKAKARGYATAIIVPEHKNETAYDYNGLNVVPCPQQTGRAVFCSDCRLCMKDEKLKASDVTIAFAAHGPSVRAKAMIGTLGLN